MRRFRSLARQHGHVFQYDKVSSPTTHLVSTAPTTRFEDGVRLLRGYGSRLASTTQTSFFLTVVRLTLLLLQLGHWSGEHRYYRPAHGVAWRSHIATSSPSTKWTTGKREALWLCTTPCGAQPTRDGSCSPGRFRAFLPSSSTSRDSHLQRHVSFLGFQVCLRWFAALNSRIPANRSFLT